LVAAHRRPLPPLLPLAPIDPTGPRAKKLVWLGFINADTEDEAIEKAAIEFKVAAHRLVAKRRS
jgi:hypothetical protein